MNVDILGHSLNAALTWGVQMNLIGGVILGADDHHCKEDECYYIQRAVWNSTLCDRSDFAVGKSKWIMTLLYSELLQFSVQFTFNFMIKTCGSKAWLCAACPLCCMLAPSIMFILGAALFNGVFAKYLFVPFFAALLTEWATALVVPPLLTLPIYFTHRAQFKRLFPGAKNIQDFKTKEKLEPGCDRGIQGRASLLGEVLWRDTLYVGDVHENFVEL